MKFSAKSVSLKPSFWCIYSSNKHGGVRSVITDSRGGQLSLAATGYLDCPEKGFLFVADESKPVVWKLNPADGSVLKTNVMSIEGLPQGMSINQFPPCT